MKYIMFGLLFFILGCTNQYKLFKCKIQDRKFFLESFANSSIQAPKNANITLGNGTFEGFGGCNKFNGTFTMDKDYIHFKIKDIETKVCNQLYKERNYIKLIVKSTNLIIKGKKVLFNNQYDTTLMTFMR